MIDKNNNDSRIDYLEAIHYFDSSLQDYLETDELLNAAGEALSNIVKSRCSIKIYLIDNKSGDLILKSHRGGGRKSCASDNLMKGEGLAGSVAEAKRPLFLHNITAQSGVERKFIKNHRVESYAGIPIFFKKEILGVIDIYYSNSKVFTDHEKELLTGIGRKFGAALQRVRKYEKASQQARRYIAISHAVTVSRQLGTLEEVLNNIAKVLVQSLGFDQSWIGIIDEDVGVLQGKVAFGIGAKGKSISTRFPIHADTSNPAVLSIIKQEPIVHQTIDDIDDRDFREWLSELGVQSSGYVPILSGSKAEGVIAVFYTSDQIFAEEDIKALMSVAEQAAIAIENAKLYDRVRNSEERYRTLFESAGTCLVILNRDLIFRLVNNAFERLSGYTKEELSGNMSFISFINKNEEDIVKKLNNPPESFEIDFRSRDGLNKQIHITTTLIPGSSDILVSMVDMTRQKELEKRLFRSEELAAIGELSAGIAHEIRNPLVAITTSVNLLKEEKGLSKEGEQLLDVVKEESDHLAAIVDDFLQFARPKKPVFNKEDVNTILKDVVKKYKELYENKIKWKEEYDEQLPLIQIDRHQIHQVITNLLLNSIDAMEDGGVVTVKTRVETKVGVPHVRISISDTGIGIPEDKIEKIFQPFYSLKEKGTGLGLSICHRIVNNHNGEIFVKSKEGRGTTFFIDLPAVK